MKYKITKDEGSIKTPFDIEAILRACPLLYAEWRKHPFYIDIDKKGHVCVVYFK